MECIVCGTVIEGRGDKQTCSTKCRVTLNRRKDDVTLSDVTLKPANYGQSDCQCKMCQSTRSRANGRLINHGPWKSAGELAANEVNRVPLPGDVDYVGRV